MRYNSLSSKPTFQMEKTLGSFGGSTFGVQRLKVFNEIQASNMSKLGPDGKPIYREDGKILKGPGYFKPNISAIIYGKDC